MTAFGAFLTRAAPTDGLGRVFVCVDGSKACEMFPMQCVP